jgi:hypothetical protein
MRLTPLHHPGGEGGEDRNWLQQINDSEGGVLAASVLHSVGALLFAAGIAVYLYVAHGLRRSRQGLDVSRVGLLPFAHGFTLGGIALNGVGGLMRLFQSDHPGLERLGDSTWVQVLFVKHLFLFAGIGLAAWLAWHTRRLAQAPRAPERLAREGPRMVGGAVASLTTILLAAVLGAVAGNVDLAADLGRTPGADPGPGDPHAGHEPRVLADVETAGTITGTPVAAGSETTRFAVPDEADRITVVVRWTAATVELAVRLLDPTGNAVNAEVDRVGTSVTAAIEGEAVVGGTWRAVVSTSQALNERYTIRVTLVESGGLGNVLERTVTLRAGQTGNWYEVNLLMRAGREIAFEWRVLNSTQAVYFDVHLHPDPATVTYPVQGEWNQYNGTYRHDGSTQGPSLLWENGSSENVRIWYRITGAFSVHSTVPANAG